ncbi:hypothetical protein D3C87_2115300 [compost metagenome]
MLQQITLGRNSVTPQQVGNVYFLNVIDFDPATSQVHESGNASNMERKTFEETKNFATPATTSRRNC